MKKHIYGKLLAVITLVLSIGCQAQNPMTSPDGLEEEILKREIEIEKLQQEREIVLEGYFEDFENLAKESLSLALLLHDLMVLLPVSKDDDAEDAKIHILTTALVFLDVAQLTSDLCATEKRDAGNLHKNVSQAERLLIKAGAKKSNLNDLLADFLVKDSLNIMHLKELDSQKNMLERFRNAYSLRDLKKYGEEVSSERQMIVNALAEIRKVNDEAKRIKEAGVLTD